MLKFAISGKGGIKEMVKMKQMPNIDYLELLRFVVCLDNMVSQTYPCILVYFFKVFTCKSQRTGFLLLRNT